MLKEIINSNQILEIFEKTQGFLKGHFQLTSGKHSQGYMQCAKVLQYPEYARLCGSAIADLYISKNITCVIGPAMGGIIIAYEVASALGVRALFSERVDGKMKLRRGFEVNSGERVLVVEDVITTGGSVGEVVDLMQQLGVEVVGVSSIIDRSNDAVMPFKVPFRALAKVKLDVFDPSECPLCKQCIPINKPGSRI